MVSKRIIFLKKLEYQYLLFEIKQFIPDDDFLSVLKSYIKNDLEILHHILLCQCFHFKVHFKKENKENLLL